MLGPKSRFLALVAVACSAVAGASHARLPYNASELLNQSEYALGSYTYNVVFIQDDVLRNPNESTHPPLGSGDIIHWTQAELDERQQRIIDAADFWNAESAARHHPDARLDIDINFVNGGQPITVSDTTPTGGALGFLNGYGEALTSIDPIYAGLSDIGAVQRFNRDTRNQFDTHWAFTLFVRPYEGVATARLNGPNINQYEDDPLWTYVHEIGHIFGALDEYNGRTNTREGYLYAENTNSVNLPDGSPNPNSIPAIMRDRDQYNFSDGTINQIGWTDTDGDTIPDILDTNPTFLFPSVGPSADDPSQYVFNALSLVDPIVSENPRVARGITINTLTSAQYRTDGGDWVDLLPTDGSFGDYIENLLIPVQAPAPDDPLVEVRVYNNFGNYGETSFFGVVVPEPASVTALLLGLGLACRRPTAGLHS